jgi:hypothetical protein
MTSYRSARDYELMDRICAINKDGRKSPLCNDWILYELWKRISTERWAEWSIVLWIMLAESHIGANYVLWCDSSWNNWWGVKARRNDDQIVRKNQAIPNDWNWNHWPCWLYKFDSMEDYFITKANIIGDWYRWCFKRRTRRNMVECISYKYVWDPKVSELHWVNNVMSIAR